jgi:hypothetical protein
VTKIEALRDTRIPKVFHWIWLGPAPMPESHRVWMQSWIRHHPGWEARVWTESDLPALVNQAEFERATTWAQRSDIARYEILLGHGGVYLDTDVECMRNIEALTEGCHAFAGWEREGLIGNAVLGASAGHRWMADVVAELPAAMASAWLTLEQSGPAFLTRLTAGRADVTLFDPVVFYPRPSDAAPDQVQNAVWPASHAVHHFTKSWEPDEIRRVGDLLRRQLLATLPRGTTAVVVPGWVELPDLPGRSVRPFVERDGVDWGLPADDGQALAELDRQRRSGVDVVVFLEPARWWLEFYRGLAVGLEESACSAHRDQYLTAFWLTPPPA